MVFKENTLNKYIVMGMNTYLSLPRKLLNRKYIVLTHKDCKLDDDIVVCHNILELMEYIKGPDFPTGGIVEGKRGTSHPYLRSPSIWAKAGEVYKESVDIYVPAAGAVAHSVRLVQPAGAVRPQAVGHGHQRH